TQLDIEAAFVDAGDVMGFMGRAVRAAVVAATGEDTGEIPHMTWLEAQERFGTDKPDTRFDMELTDLTEAFVGTEFRAFQPPSVIKGIRVPGEGEATRARLDRLTDNAKKVGAAGLVWMRVGADGALDSPVAKFLSDDERTAVVKILGADSGDLLLLVAGDRV